MMFSTANHADVLFLHPCSLNTRAPRSTFGKSLPRVLLSQVLLSLSQVRLGLSQKLLGLSQVLFSLSQALLGLSQVLCLFQVLLSLSQVPLNLPLFRNRPSQISYLRQLQILLDHPGATHPPRMWAHASPCLMKVVLILSQRGWDPQNLPRFLLSATPFSLRRPTCRPV